MILTRYKQSISSKMTLPKAKWREIVLQMLCNLDCTGSLDESSCGVFMRDLSITKKQFFATRDFALQVFNHRKALDERLSLHGVSSVMDSMERSILRLALVMLEDTPPEIVIAEAVRLCNKFADPERASFIQAIINRELP